MSFTKPQIAILILTSPMWIPIVLIGMLIDLWIDLMIEKGWWE